MQELKERYKDWPFQFTHTCEVAWSPAIKPGAGAQVSIHVPSLNDPMCFRVFQFTCEREVQLANLTFEYTPQMFQFMRHHLTIRCVFGLGTSITPFTILASKNRDSVLITSFVPGFIVYSISKSMYPKFFVSGMGWSVASGNPK